jgi:Domain of unknown function (DUF4190)
VTLPDDGPHRGTPPPSGAPYRPEAYGSPGYGAPGYGAPGYGAPPGWPPAGWRRPTNTAAILAVVLAFVFAPAGLALGVVARRQIRATGEDGDGLALAGIIVGGVVTTLYALGIVMMIVGLMAVRTSY